MKTAILITLMALGLTACCGTKTNSGAPPAGYETGYGYGQGPDHTTYSTPDAFPSWQRYRYEGITPNTPP